ncbi:DUF4214 domain-containing protein [Methylobacterium tarhaniae]|uniref:DUF4214 domain-containing protein n=1 Tax=Methylobacterium tarhaniae TaxID=1187852 RepID=UPI003CFD13FE
MVQNVAPININTNSPYRLSVVRSDNGVAAMNFYYNDELKYSSARAGWDDAIPWESGTYYASLSSRDFGSGPTTMFDFIQDPVGRQAVQLHTAQSASSGNAISASSFGCLVADLPFLNNIAAFMRDSAEGVQNLQIDVSGDFPVFTSIRSTQTEAEEGTRFEINVNLNQSISKDIWMNIGLVPGSVADDDDYKFVKNPIPNSTSDDLRYLGNVSNAALKTDKFESGYYVKIPKGQTTGSFVLDVVSDNESEGDELARFQIKDYAINSPFANGNERLYSDYVNKPKILITSAGPPSVADVTFKDQGDFPVSASGANFTFRRVVPVKSGDAITYNFQAYSIPDGLKIFDGATTYADTGGLISGGKAGNFTISNSTNGFLTIVVSGNVDPGTAWDVFVDRSAGSTALRFAPLNSNFSISNSASTPFIASDGVGGATAPAVASLQPAQQVLGAFDASTPATFQLNLVAGKTYALTAISNDPENVDPVIRLIGANGENFEYRDTASSINSAGYFTATTNETVTAVVSDTFGRSGSAIVNFNEINLNDLNAFSLGLESDLILEGGGLEAGSLGIDITRLGNAGAPAAVSWRLVPTGTSPLSAEDFGGALPQGTVTFAAGQQTAFVSLALPADGRYESVESGAIELFDPVGGILSTLDLHGQDSFRQIFAVDSYDVPITDLGSALDDQLIGGPLNDKLFGAGSGDEISGLGGNDLLSGGTGDDTIDGGEGIDTAVYDSFWKQNVVAGDLAERNISGPEGADIVRSVEILKFTDGRFVSDVTDPVAAVYRLYKAALQRAPDSIGLNSWSSALTRGVGIFDIASGFLNSSEFQQRYGNLTNGAFVQRLYQDVLGREPDSSGLNDWTRALDAGSISRSEVLVGFSESPEHVGRTTQEVEAGIWDVDDSIASVARLYYAALDRTPDGAGLKNWGDLISTGRTLREVADGLVNSPEFQAKNGMVDNAHFVELLYNNALDRVPDSGGLSSWVGLLDSGALDRAGVVVGFSESIEHQIKTANDVNNGITL